MRACCCSSVFAIKQKFSKYLFLNIKKIQMLSNSVVLCVVMAQSQIRRSAFICPFPCLFAVFHSFLIAFSPSWEISTKAVEPSVLFKSVDVLAWQSGLGRTLPRKQSSPRDFLCLYQCTDLISPPCREIFSSSFLCLSSFIVCLFAFSFHTVSPRSLCLLVHPSFICFIYPFASCLFLLCFDYPYLCSTFQTLLSSLIFDVLFSRHKKASHCVLLYLNCLQREKVAKMMSPSKVHLAGVHTEKILLPGSTLFTKPFVIAN